MPSESIKFVLQAEDLASTKIKTFAEDTALRMRDVGSKTKASTELAGTLANTLGGSAFGSAAGQLAQLTERMSAFSEVAKAGNAGAIAFKAGMIGVAAVGGYTLGKTLYDLAAGTSELKEKMLEAADASREFGSALNLQAVNDLRQTQQLFELTGKSAEEFGDLLTERILQQTDHIATLKEELQSLEDEWDFLQTTGEGERMKMLEAQIESSENLLKSLKGQRAEVAQQNSELAKAIQLEKQRQDADKKWASEVGKGESEIERLRKELHLASLKGEEALKYKAFLMGANQEQRQEIESLLKQKQLIDEKAKAELELAAAKKSAMAEEQAMLKKTQDLHKTTVEQLTQKLAGMKYGEEFGRAFQLIQSGMDEASAKTAAQIESLLGEVDALGNSKAQVAPDVQAKESRLLGNGGKTLDKAEVAAREQKQRDAQRDQLIQESNALLQELIRRQPKKVGEIGPV